MKQDSGYTINQGFWGITYIVLISLLLLFHVFNNIQLSETVKVFHLFSAAAIGTSFFLTKTKDKIIKTFHLLLIWSFVSCMLSPIDGSLLSDVKFLIVALSVSLIPFVPFQKLVLYVNAVIPIALMLLVRNYFAESVYRYQGFYDDPNYFCTTLLVFFFYIQLLWKETEKKILKAGLVVEMLLIFFLVGTSISRTGLACLLMMIIVFWWDMFKANKGRTLLALIVLFAIVFHYFGDYIMAAIEGYTMRETENKDTLASASNLRWEISMRGLTYVFSHPQYLFQGFGIGTYSQAYVLEGWHASTHHLDHNTITSWFSEQGLIGFILLIRFLILLFKRLKNSSYLKESGLRMICICVFCVFVLFSTSINMTNYLPFWFLMFTLVAMAQTSNNVR